jgi:hypothetical protein
VFFYRENGTYFNENHVKVKDRSGKKLCPFGLGFPQVEQGISSALMGSWIVKNILLSLQIFCFRQSMQDSQEGESNSSKTDPQSIRLSKLGSGSQTMKEK